jgi:hypothetical protein
VQPKEVRRSKQRKSATEPERFGERSVRMVTTSLVDEWI